MPSNRCSGCSNYGQQRDQAKAAINRGKQADFDLDALVDQFACISPGCGPLLQLFLQLQCLAVAADGRIDDAEPMTLLRVARRLRPNEADVTQLEAHLRASAGGPSATGGNATQDRLAAVYAALGVTPEADAAVVKRAYCKLISKNHPDKPASRGSPESMRAVAEERLREKIQPMT